MAAGGFAVFRGCPCAFPLLWLILTLMASINLVKMSYTLDTLEFSRKRVDLFLSMRFKDKVRISGFSEASWTRWMNGDRNPSTVILEQIAESLSNHSSLLAGLNPMEVLAGILIIRSQKANPRQAQTAQAG